VSRARPSWPSSRKWVSSFVRRAPRSNPPSSDASARRSPTHPPPLPRRRRRRLPSPPPLGLPLRQHRWNPLPSSRHRQHLLLPCLRPRPLRALRPRPLLRRHLPLLPHLLRRPLRVPRVRATTPSPTAAPRLRPVPLCPVPSLVRLVPRVRATTPSPTAALSVPRPPVVCPARRVRHSVPAAASPVLLAPTRG